MTEAKQSDPKNPTRRTRRILAWAVPIVAILGAVFVAALLVITRPQAVRGKPLDMTAAVRIETATLTTENIVVEAQGTVVPAREIILRSRVGGEIVSVGDEFIDGGLVEAYKEILKIDPVDSELAVARAASRLATVKYEQSLEKGRLHVARREWELLDAGATATEEERALALREPQQVRIAADLKAAEAELRQAELNLERTSVVAPFNAVITKRFAELGARVSTQDSLANLVGTDEFWIQVSVPVDRLRWLDVPRGPGDTGSPALVYAPGQETPWKGTVIRLLSDLEARGRMARLVVQVRDPMCLEEPRSHRVPLLLGSYVRVALEGRRLEDVIRIPRAALRDDRIVWIAQANETNDTLDIRAADVVWRGPEEVFLQSGLDPGERVIVSDVAIPVQGMQIQVDDGPRPMEGGAASEETGRDGGEE